MGFLLLYIAPGRKFDQELIKHLWRERPGVSNLRERCMPGAIVSATYVFEGDTTLLELKEDLETIALSGMGPASVQMAFQIQLSYSEPLHVVDESYSFDLVIRDFPTSDALGHAIDSVNGSGAVT